MYEKLKQAIRDQMYTVTEAVNDRYWIRFDGTRMD